MSEKYELVKEDGKCPYCGSDELAFKDRHKRVSCSDCHYSSAHCPNGLDEFIPRSMDGLKMKAVIPADEVEAGDDIYYTFSGERYLVGDVSVDTESGYTYYALIDKQTGEFEQLDRIKPDREVTVYTNRSVKESDN